MTRRVDLAVLVGAALALVATAAFAGGRARIDGGPARVTPGTLVSYRASGLPARARVTVWLVPTINRGGNCCGIRPFVRRSRASAGGVARPLFRWPRYFERCGAASGCERVPWRSGQRVDVLVTWNSLSGRALRVVRVR